MKSKMLRRKQRLVLKKINHWEIIDTGLYLGEAVEHTDYLLGWVAVNDLEKEYKQAHV